MGYEVVVYFGQVAEFLSDDGGDKYFMELGRVNIHKVPYPARTAPEWYSKRDDAVQVYIYGSDGDTEITEDMYGDKLWAIPLDVAIEALREDIGRGTHWHSALVLLAALERLQGLSSLAGSFFRDPYVMVFGH
jgi:hypothetical protein